MRRRGGLELRAKGSDLAIRSGQLRGSVRRVGPQTGQLDLELGVREELRLEGGDFGQVFVASPFQVGDRRSE
jgi:hypothetical protein